MDFDAINAAAGDGDTGPSPIDLLLLEERRTPDDDRKQELLAVSDPSSAVLGKSIIDEKIRDMANRGLETSTEVILSLDPTGAATTIPILASRYDKGDLTDAEFGAYSSMYGDEDGVPTVVTAQDWRNQKAAARNAEIEGLAAEARADLQDEGFARTQARGGVPALVGEITGEVLSFSHMYRVVNIAREVFPDLDISRLTPGKGIAEFKKRLAADPSKLSAVVEAAKRESSFLYESGYQADGLVATLTDGLTEEDPGTLLNNVIAWAEGLAVLGTGIRAARKAAGVGLKASQGHSLIAQTKQGAGKMWDQVKGRQTSTAADAIPPGTRIEDLMDGIAMPKVDGKDVKDVLFLFDEYVPASSRADVLADKTAVFGSGLAPHLNKTVTQRAVDGGVEGTVLFGRKTGTGYATQKGAESAARIAFGSDAAYKAVQTGNKWFVEVTKVKQWGAEDIKTAAGFDPVRPGGRWLGMASKMFGFSENVIASSNQAARTGEKHLAAMAKMTQPFWSMPAGSRNRIGVALAKGDAEGVVYDIDTLSRRFELNPAEIRGYAIQRKAQDIGLIVKDTNAVQKARALGFLNYPISGNGLIGGKVLVNGVQDAQRATKALSPAGIKAVDAATGAVRTLDSLTPKEAVIRLLRPTANGERYGIIEAKNIGKGQKIDTLLTATPGYLVRPYRYSHYIKEVVDGRYVTRLGANSPNEAARALADLQATDPTKVFQVRRAGEVGDEVDDLSDFEAMWEAGLINDGRRSGKPIVNLDGDSVMFSLEDRLRAMMGNIEVAAGVERWAIASTLAFNARYGHLLSPGQKFSVGVNVDKIFARGANPQEVRDAMTYAKFIQDASGQGTAAKWKITEGVRNSVSDWLFNRGLTGLGNQVSGLSNTALNTIKSTVATVYLSSNPQRQIILQMSQVPSYAGTAGGLAYAGKGAFARDFMAVMGDVLAPGSRITKALGHSEADTLIAQYERSGIMSATSHHTMNSGLAGDIANNAMLSKATRAGDWTQAAAHTMRAVGIDAGILMERTSAWLFSRNRWLHLNPGKKIDAAAEREIAQTAESLSLAPNRTDVLGFQKGALGVFTQFLAMQVKMQARIIGAVIPGVKDGGFSRTERLRMAGILLSTYGLRGFGLDSLALRVASLPGVAGAGPELQNQVKDIVNNGLADYALNTWLQSWVSDPNEEPSDIAFTESFSPVRGVGTTVGALVSSPALLFDMVFGTESSHLEGIGWQAPALGLTQDMASIIKMGYDLALVDSAEDTAESWPKTLALTEQLLRRIPLTSNILQAQVASNWRIKTDRLGSVTASANHFSASAALFGVKTREEVDAWTVQTFLYGQPGDIPDGATSETVRSLAKDHAKFLFPYLDKVAESGRIDSETAGILDEINAFKRSGLDEIYRDEYESELKEMVYNRIRPKMEKLVGTIEFNLGKPNGIPITKDMRDQLERLPLPAEAKQELLTTIDILTGN